jgi:hypothetical protein
MGCTLVLFAAKQAKDNEKQPGAENNQTNYLELRQSIKLQGADPQGKGDKEKYIRDGYTHGMLPHYPLLSSED